MLYSFSEYFMKTQTFTIDLDDKKDVEKTMEKLLFMYKVNKGRQEVQQGNILTHNETIKILNDA